MGKMNLRKSAKGQDCTLEIMGVCNYDPQTTELCDVDYSGGRCLPSDVSAIHACSSCRELLYGYKSPTLEYANKTHWYVARALIRTHERFARLVLDKRRVGDLYGN